MYTEPHTTPWAGLHTFIVHLGPQSCRCPGLLSEAAFDCVMDALNWRMPYHLRAFHCSSPETAAANPVLRAMPEFSAPLDKIKPGKVFNFFCFPLRWYMGDGAMSRCVAFIDEDDVDASVPDRTYKYGGTGYADESGHGDSGLEYMRKLFNRNK